LALDAVLRSVAQRALRLQAAAAVQYAAAAHRTLPLGASVWTSFSAAALIKQIVNAGKEALARVVPGQHLIRKAQINLAHLIEPL
jgi:hypothetical protein